MLLLMPPPGPPPDPEGPTGPEEEDPGVKPMEEEERELDWFPAAGLEVVGREGLFR